MRRAYRDADARVSTSGRTALGKSGASRERETQA
jgi:hypothetical protein